MWVGEPRPPIPFSMLVPKVTVFFALSTVPAVPGLFFVFFFFFPEEEPPPLPPALAPFLGGVRNDPGGGCGGAIGASGAAAVSAGDAGEAAPSSDARLFFFFFFFLSDDESGLTFCVIRGRPVGGEGRGCVL